MVKKGLILFLVLITIVTALNFTALAAPKQVTIKMSNWLQVEVSTAGIFKKMIAEFERKNPGIKVETIGLPFNQYKDQVLVMSTSGNAPDVIMGNSQMMVSFDGSGILTPLKGLISSKVLNDIFPNNLEGTTFQGKIMALSWAPHPIAMFYNKELFKQAGLDPEKAPKTWDEMMNAAKKVAALKKDKDGNQIYGIALPNAKVSHSGSVAMGVIYTYGGQFIDRKGKVVFDNQGTKDALKFFKDMVDSGVMPSGMEIKDVRGLFASGKVGMIFDGDFGRNTFRTLSGKGQEFDNIMGVGIIPTGKTGKSETVYTEHELAIAKTSKQKKAAAALVEFLMSKENMIIYHKDQAILSARKSIASLPEMNEDNYMRVFNKQSETARPLPATSPFFDNAMLEVTKAMERILITNEDINKVVKETQTTIKDLYQQK